MRTPGTFTVYSCMGAPTTQPRVKILKEAGAYHCLLLLNVWNKNKQCTHCQLKLKLLSGLSKKQQQQQKTNNKLSLKFFNPLKVSNQNQ